MTRVLQPRWGRRLGDFEVGACFAHPWEVTVDEGMLAMVGASFLETMPACVSDEMARAVGLPRRVVPPLWLLNLGLSFSVHDVSEQAVANLGYHDVRFPRACHPGDTLVASSTVLEARPTSDGTRGTVRVRTVLETTAGAVVCVFERTALVPAGRLDERPVVDGRSPLRSFDASSRWPPWVDAIGAHPWPRDRRGGLGGHLDDFRPGDVIVHPLGRTVGDSESTMLTWLARNTHPLHFDAGYCADGGSFTGARVVYGGLVLQWVASLASRELAAQAVWDIGYDDGAHPAPVAAGDTLYAASKVLRVEPVGPVAGDVTVRLVGLKNVRPERLLDRGVDPFVPERDRPRAERIAEKVVEITRTLRVLRRP
ncbi:MAG: MaoC family dehydratase [Myxococcota bacterium]|nr:MaoC family dehydratase [Myxococcota bacterium]MDW8362582.1 MaoC family dehydratase [Myxococcales bacterium]